MQYGMNVSLFEFEIKVVDLTWLFSSWLREVKGWGGGGGGGKTPEPDSEQNLAPTQSTEAPRRTLIS